MNNKIYRVTLLFNAKKSFNRQIIEGIGEYFQASKSEWDIYIDDDFFYHPETLSPQILSCDGIIVDYDTREIEEVLHHIHVPIVGIGGSFQQVKRYPPTHYVATDNHALINMAYQHLRDKGLTHFAFYTYPTPNLPDWAREREETFHQLMQRQHHRLWLHRDSRFTPYHCNSEYTVAWLRQLPHPIGIIAATDELGYQLLKLCRCHGIAVPEQVCVIGIDNDDISRFLSSSSLSSIIQGTRKMGFMAAQILHQVFVNPQLPPQQLTLPPVGVIERHSTAYQSELDPIVLQTLHFIRHNVRHNLKVEHVIAAMKLSRSTLAKRFKHCLGKSVHDVIFQTKMEYAQTLLTDSNLSIAEVSTICGYPTLQYFHFAFKKYCQQTPKEYRNSHRL